MPDKARILHISESSETGGAETVMLNIVNNIDKARYDSIVVLMKTGWLNQRFEECGISPVVIPSARSYDVDFLRRLWVEIRRQRAGLIHSHLPDVNAYSCLAGMLTGVPVVTTYHGMISGPKKPTLSDKLKLFLVRSLSRKVVAVSESLKKELVDLAHFPSEKVETIYNGVNWTAFDRPYEISAKRKELGICVSDKVVGIVANLKPTKGYEYFVRAAAIISKNVEGAKFLIIGEEEESLKSSILTEITALGLSDRVRFLGFRDDIPDLLRLLDVFVLSSITEGMSIATVEAMGAGVPVVVTRSGGPEELVEDGKTGFLVPPKDERSLADKTLLLLKNRELAGELAGRASVLVRQRFGIGTMIADYEKVYEYCLRGSHLN